MEIRERERRQKKEAEETYSCQSDHEGGIIGADVDVLILGDDLLDSGDCNHAC